MAERDQPGERPRVGSFPEAVRDRTDGRTLATIGRHLGPPVLVFVAVVGFWHGAVVAFDVPSIVLPSPIEVGSALVTLRGTLLGDAAVTGATAVAGLAGGCVAGIALAFVMTDSRTAIRIVLPYVIALRIAPLIAIAPLVFLWFGRGVPARALLVATLVLFPMTVATLDGLRATPEPYLALVRSVAASPLAVFFRVRVPAAAPSVFAGFKLAVTLSVIGAVVAEFVTLDSGLGYRVFVTAERLRTAESYAALVALSALGLALYLVPVVVERITWLGSTARD